MLVWLAEVSVPIFVLIRLVYMFDGWRFWPVFVYDWALAISGAFKTLRQAINEGKLTLPGGG